MVPPPLLLYWAFNIEPFFCANRPYNLVYLLVRCVALLLNYKGVLKVYKVKQRVVSVQNTTFILLCYMMNDEWLKQETLISLYIFNI